MQSFESFLAIICPKPTHLPADLGSCPSTKHDNSTSVLAHRTELKINSLPAGKPRLALGAKNTITPPSHFNL